ncbi:MAG: DUF4325 domain-containing protein [Clostridiales bacterium]|nr:DUF4325 domain-containing protein [Clostridiales bacterium]
MNFLSETISIKESISPDLALRNSAENFFKKINQLASDRIIIDFTSVTSITRSFADEYLNQKKKTKKTIIDANVPEIIVKMFKVVEKKPEKYVVPQSNQQKPLLLKISV